ncbi:MAG: 2-oxoglutarate dehydrogenase complex dihydrolipoyllysine-residue succinyltransferase [Phycisphaerales bacterium]|jgi:2-oxoglutarate dehydrogenase E2 component (dihydrolipoamide succinyltransferase)|nr:2-oxoglutarate dehydrogenase complex dihydrolipoyllysine-residue succinyltransferase [Phycisphaerales bacterium]
MPSPIIVPEFGESVASGVISRWLVKDGEAVKRDQPVLELETDKVTAEIVAPAAGVLKHGAKAGDTVAVKSTIGQIVEGAGAPTSTPAPAPAPAAAPAIAGAAVAATNGASTHGHNADVRATPLARKLADEQGVDISTIAGTGPGGRVRESDVVAAAAVGGKAAAVAGGGIAAASTIAPVSAPTPAPAPAAPKAGARRERLSPLRQRIAQRLVDAQHTAAMLTTFNEVDMSAVMALRAKYKEEFEKKHAVGLGFMSFFVKAAANALRQMPIVNAYLVQGEAGVEVEYHATADIAVAVSTPKGLTVPVLRDCGSLSFAGVEKGIKDLATRARDGKLTLEELQGGTFTITNGGVFGSLLSTPILNAPQSAILGMHAIKNRPMEHPDKPGEIALRPMMYLALSYDHRILDGSDAVTFLVSIKNALERPERLLLDM